MEEISELLLSIILTVCVEILSKCVLVNEDPGISEDLRGEIPVPFGNGNLKCKNGCHSNFTKFLSRRHPNEQYEIQTMDF